MKTMRVPSEFFLIKPQKKKKKTGHTQLFKFADVLYFTVSRGSTSSSKNVD